MRLLQAMAGAERGGAEAFFARLAAALERTGIAQRVVIRRNPWRADGLRKQGVEPVELGFGSPLDLITRWRLKREIARFRPDVVLTWMSRATRFCPDRVAGVPFVHVARLGGYYDLKYYRHCDHLIVNTEDLLDHVRDGGWPMARAHLLPNFVDAAPAPPVDRASLDTPVAATLLVALGRLHENKAFDVLIRAIGPVPQAYLWIAGSGPLRGALEEEARRCGVLDRVRFLGWRDDVAALFAAADVFVCPSRAEPLGNVVIEAWAHGVPCIAAASTGPAALIDDGETGLLVPVDEPYLLTNAIIRVTTSAALRDKLVAGGRAAYESHYTEAAVVARYLAFFDQVAGEDHA
jgi:glycosyltransferase involved in cell wall biosynthesis